MVKRLIGVFERKMTDQELAHFQSVCTMQKIMPVVDQKYDVLLWWLRATDQKLSNSQPCMYEFQDGPNISVIYLQNVRLLATYHLRAVDLEKLKSLKALANGLRNMDRAILDIREETVVHRSKMKRMTGVAPSLVSKGVFRTFCSQIFIDKDHVYEAARRLCEARRYLFDVGASKSSNGDADDDHESISSV